MCYKQPETDRLHAWLAEGARLPPCPTLSWGAVLANDPHLRSGHPLGPWMCHHIREPTVFFRVSMPPCLNFDRFHRSCLSAGRTAGWAKTVVPVPRGDHVPLRAAWSSLLCVSRELLSTPTGRYPTGRYHGRTLIRFSSSCVCHPSQQGVCTHAGSGPLRVRRRLLTACLGDKSIWARS